VPRSKRSPILRPLLKLPGQKLDEDLEAFLEDHLLAPILVLVMIAAMCLVEWAGYLKNSPRNPWIYTWWLLGAAVVIAIHWRRQWREAARLKLGREGERAVAEYLNIRLDADSRVLHGVPLEGGTADHVLICTRGVFVIETKARSLPRRGDPVVHVADTGVRVNGSKPDRNPIVQVQRYVDALNRLLPTLATFKTEAIGIVVFPSYKVIDDRRVNRCAWVLEPKGLAGRLDREPKRLSADEVVFLTRRLASHIRPPN
jgi:hypothetical protein